jgi:glucosamine-phosphate N-acetyltransferase
MSLAAFTIRLLELSDFDRGYLQLLSQLTMVGDVTKQQFREHLTSILVSEDYNIVVIEDNASKRIVGSATLFIERKLIHSCGRVGHIEDVVVDQSCRGSGIGGMLLDDLTTRAQRCGCYKVILNCAPHNVGFYDKCGFVENGVQMAKYY